MVARLALRNGPGGAANDDHLPRRARTWLGKGHRLVRGRPWRPIRGLLSHCCRHVYLRCHLRGDGLPGLPAQERRRRPEPPGHRSSRRRPARLVPLIDLLRRTSRQQPERHAHKHAQYRPRRPDAWLRLRALRRAGDPDRFAHHLELLPGCSLRLPSQRIRSLRPDSPDHRTGRPSTLDRWLFRPRGWLASPRHHAPWDVSRCTMDTSAHRQDLTPHPHRRKSVPRPPTDTIPVTRCSWDGANPPVHPPAERIFPEVETLTLAREAQDVQPAVFRVAEAALSGVPGAEDPEFDLTPLDTFCTLREPGVRDHRAIPDEHHDRDLARAHVVPAGTLVRLAALVVAPEAWRKVDVATPRLLHQRCDEDIRTEEVLVLHQPGGPVLRILEERGTQHGMPLPAGVRGLGVDVGHEPVPELDRSPEVAYELSIVLPRLCRRTAVASAVRAEHAERQPTPVEVLRGRVGETPYKVAPEREPAKA